MPDSVDDLLVDLAGPGIELEARGNRIRFSPRSVMTPDLAARVKASKAELLSILQSAVDPPIIAPDGWPAGSIDPDDVAPCPECGSLEQWQTLIGNWRCLLCDPPIKTRRLQERAEQTRRCQELTAPLN